MRRRRVVLPTPVSPTSDTNSFWRTWRFTDSRIGRLLIAAETFSNRTMALRKCSVMRDFYSQFDGADHALLIGNALSGDIECGAVIGRGAHDIEACRVVHARLKS